MAIRNIRLEGDELLRKTAKIVKSITPNVLTLLDDMAETMRSKDGAGLAAPQVGVLRRIVVVNLGEDKGIAELINPEIVEENGAQSRLEGCLSIPGKIGTVERPAYVKVKALDRNGRQIFVEGEEMLAVALCHELDHLDGVLYIDKAASVEDVGYGEEDEEDYEEAVD